jgi:hypothetical protein
MIFGPLVNHLKVIRYKGIALLASLLASSLFSLLVSLAILFCIQSWTEANLPRSDEETITIALYQEFQNSFEKNPSFHQSNINLYRDGQESPYIHELFGFHYNNAQPLSRQDLESLPEFSFLSYDAFKKAWQGYQNVLKRYDSKIKKPQFLTVIDFSLPSTVRRFFVLDMVAKEVLFNTWVSHGLGSVSDPQSSLTYPMATQFGNTQATSQSSLGFFIVQNQREGRFAYNLNLQGIDKNLNDQALSRGIIIHESGTVDPWYIVNNHTLGLSEGCLQLPIYESGRFYGLKDRPLVELIINTIQDSSILFAYAADPTLETSVFLH